MDEFEKIKTFSEGLDQRQQNIAKAVDFCTGCYLLEQGLIKRESRFTNITEINNRMFNK